MTALADTRVRFHLSLNVADLDRSVEFFRTLFDAEPAKRRPDYAKFEPDEPPLVLSLEPAARPAGGPLNHLGFRMPDAASLVAMQERLERAGVRTDREDGVECCYARQTKFWARDPDGTLWEVYTFEGDIVHRGVGQSEQAVTGLTAATTNSAAPKPQVVWEHRMGEPVPETLPLGDGGADEVRLLGTLNLSLSKGEQSRLAAEALRALKPGGRLFVHVLCGEEAVDAPVLPGPAGAVRFVPHEADPVRLLEGAGFAGVRMVKFDANPCFVRGGVGMRELRLEGWKPDADGHETREVMYRGPFRHVTDDSGYEYPRGERVRVPARDAARLSEGTGGEVFVVFDPKLATAEVSCG
jgi:catechol 2,3-dioxygenase-like lactoylglutathione lyase family enzyme